MTKAFTFWEKFKLRKNCLHGGLPQSPYPLQLFCRKAVYVLQPSRTTGQTNADSLFYSILLFIDSLNGSILKGTVSRDFLVRFLVLKAKSVLFKLALML
jgi:hypothetical protein